MKLTALQRQALIKQAEQRIQEIHTVIALVEDSFPAGEERDSVVEALNFTGGLQQGIIEELTN